MKIEIHFFWLFLAIFWMIASVIMTLMPSTFGSLPSAFGIDKFLHLGLFMGLSYLWARSFGASLFVCVLVIIVCTIYGLADEIIQGFVGRDRELCDFLANALGATYGAGIAHIQILSNWLRSGN